MALFKFINETYESKTVMWRIIHYCWEKAYWVYSPNMSSHSPNIIYSQFLYYKKYYYKEKGNQLIHCVLSFDSGYWERWVSAQTAEWCAVRICDLFQGFQNVAFVHLKKGQLHVHFLINTVSFLTGNKFHISPKGFRDFMKEAAFELSQEDIALLSVSYFDEKGKFRFGNQDEDSLYLNSPLNKWIF